ncbi:hypothetical protein JYU34_016086 [Plutella xylostella]|uniref:Uncharacterized protein n=1 Tax=Plutella xylostella TaxID=51655 RepID=A0ABQ7Q5D7_PLUXY|nr:hypothetical protein JYU34_016086 [Plutella xylostella]
MLSYSSLFHNTTNCNVIITTKHTCRVKKTYSVAQGGHIAESVGEPAARQAPPRYRMAPARAGPTEHYQPPTSPTVNNTAG